MCEPTDVTLQMEISTDNLRPNRYKIPELPNTKDNHLFICYTDCDAAIVRDVAEYLEAERLKCCYNQRDFLSGRKVIHSINDAIKRSMGIIIILSEESVKSNFCQHEIDLAVHASITDGYIIIPIKIQPCVIPETLKEITYIDAQNKESSELCILILNAFLQNVWHVEQERTNGLTRSISLTHYEKRFLKMSVWKFKLLVSQTERQSIRMKGFNVSDARFDEIQTIVSDSFHVQYKHIYKGFAIYTTLVFLMLSLLNVSVIYAFVAVTFGNEMDSTRSHITSSLLIGSICSIVNIWMLIEGMLFVFKCMKWRGYVKNYINESKKKLNMKLWWRINKETIRKEKYFVFYRDDVSLYYLDIVRFDPKPCQVVFERRCRNLKSLTKLVTPGEGETDTEYTERLFELYLQQNYKRLTVTSNVYGLHEMKNGASCLCTLLENDILKQDQYQL